MLYIPKPSHFFSLLAIFPQMLTHISIGCVINISNSTNAKHKFRSPHDNLLHPQLSSSQLIVTASFYVLRSKIMIHISFLSLTSVPCWLYFSQYILNPTTPYYLHCYYAGLCHLYVSLGLLAIVCHLLRPLTEYSLFSTERQNNPLKI